MYLRTAQTKRYKVYSNGIRAFKSKELQELTTILSGTLDTHYVRMESNFVRLRITWAEFMDTATLARNYRFKVLTEQSEMIAVCWVS